MRGDGGLTSNSTPLGSKRASCDEMKSRNAKSDKLFSAGREYAACYPATLGAFCPDDYEYLILKAWIEHLKTDGGRST